MNNKGQFFIISTVIMSIALTVIITLLSIPTQLTTNNLLSQSRSVFELQEIVSNFQTTTNNLYETWPTQQTFRTEFTIMNNNNVSVENDYVVVKLEIQDYALTNTMRLIRNGKIIPASFSQTSNGTLYVGFKDNIIEDNKYYIYYNILSDSETEYVEEEEITSYSETSSLITYKSPYYEIIISKTTGEITSLTVEGNVNDFVNSFGARVNSDNQQSMTATTTVLGYENNVLVVKITGTISSNVKLTQTLYLQPHMITVNQYFNITSSGTYILSYYADTTSIPNSIAYSDEVSIGVSSPTETSFDNNNYHSVFNDKTGILYLYEDASTTMQTSSGVDTKISLQETIYNPTIASQEVIIIPYYDYYNSAVITGKNYANNPFNSITRSRTDYINYLSQPLKTAVTASSSIINFYPYHNVSLNPVIIVSYNKEESNAPFILTGPSIKGNDLNTISLTSSQVSIPYTVTSKNYNNNSNTSFTLNNDANQGVTSTNYEMLNLNGEDFTITVNIEGDSVIGKVYSSNNTLVSSETLNSGINNMKINGYNVSGVYTLNIEGDNSNFKVSTSLPLISARAPLIINTTTPVTVYFETINDFDLTCKGIFETSNVVINNSQTSKIGENTNFTTTFNHTYNTKTGYDLTVTKTTLISADILISDEYCYLSPDYEVEYVLNTPSLSKNYYLINSTIATTNNTIQSTDLNFATSTKTITNSYYSWDLDSETFSYDASANWFYSGDFYACTGTYGSCTTESTTFTYDSLIENSTLIKSAYYTSNTINPIVRMYNNSNLFELILNNPNSLPYTFGINYRISGTDDTYYKTSFTNENTLGASEYTYNSYEVKSTGWNYIGKRDGDVYTALIFNTENLKQGDNSMIIDDDYLRVGLNEFNTHTVYFYITDSWNSIERMTESINNKPTTYSNIIEYSYSYSSEKLESSGYLLG